MLWYLRSTDLELRLANLFCFMCISNNIQHSSHTVNVNSHGLLAPFSSLLIDQLTGICSSLTGLYVGQIQDSIFGIGKRLAAKDPFGGRLWKSLSLAGENE